MRRSAPLLNQNEDGVVTLTAIKTIVQEAVDAAVKSIVDQLSSRVTQIEERTTRLETSTANYNQNVQEIRNASIQTRDVMSRLEQAEENGRRFSYSFDLLLHGIPEDNNSVWSTVQEFLNKHNLQEFQKALEGTAFRLGKPRSNLPGSDIRPRPILIRLLSRTAKQPLLSLMGKKNVSSGSPYFSAHFTRQQLEEIRQKATLQNMNQSHP